MGCGELFIRSFTSRETLSASEISQSFARMENWEVFRVKILSTVFLSKNTFISFLPGLKFHLQTGFSITFALILVMHVQLIIK